MKPSIDIEKLKAGDLRTLAKAITLIESTRSEDQQKAQELLHALLPFTGKSFRLGITGTPGVGKSTFIENFGLYLIQKGHKVAILAIDPSSPTNGGSILGDKTRMELLAQEKNAFIRPSPSSGTLGGVAQKTRESILLCEAAGYDYIIVETVGVGQSEVEVSKMVDFFMLMILPSGGDELQGIKKGILELADLIVVNKADGDAINLAKQTLAQYQSGVSITAQNNFWNTKVITNSSVTTKDFESIYNIFENYKQLATDNLFWNKNRQDQNVQWFDSLMREMILSKIYNNPKLTKTYQEKIEEIKNLQTGPIEAARIIVEKLFNS